MLSPRILPILQAQQSEFGAIQNENRNQPARGDPDSANTQNQREAVNPVREEIRATSRDRITLSQQSIELVSRENLDADDSIETTTDTLSSDQLETLFSQFRQFIPASGSAEIPSALPGSASIRLSSASDLQAYVELIRLFSEDKETFNDFLARIDAYLNRSQQESASSSIDISTQISEHYRAEIEARVSQQVSSGDDRTVRRIQVLTTNEEIIQAEMRQGDPLVFDLDDDGLEITRVEEGVLFDLAGSGQRKQTAFTYGGDAFLALDRNANGQIDSGKELFGEHHGAADGFDELSKFDENGDGQIDSKDAIFDRLRLFADENRDGISQDNELVTLIEQGIRSISLERKEQNQNISGNRLSAISHYSRQNGSRGLIGDLFLNYIV